MLFVSFVPVLYIGIAFGVFEKVMEQRSNVPAIVQTLEKFAHAKNFQEIQDEIVRRLNETDYLSEQEVNEARQQLRTLGQVGGLAKEEFKQKLKDYEDRYHIAPELFARSQIPGFFRILPDAEMKSLASDEPRLARRRIWCWLLMIFFSYPQGALMLILIGLIAPPLISRDLRSRAILLYFSRPISRLEYLIGKVAIPATFLVLITALPGIVLYAVGVLLSPGVYVIADTWDMPFRILAASAVLIIPTSLLAMMYSSLTHESRFATFAWFATWGLGGGAYLVAYLTNVAQNGPDDIKALTEGLDSRWSMLSIYNTVGRVQEWIFGMFPENQSVFPLIMLLVGISVVSFVVLMRRIQSPINA